MKNRPEQRKFHYIYKITRDDGKYYIGLHSTDDLDDGYFGSGQALWHSIRAHGKEKHNKEILEFLDSRVALIAREKELITEDQVKDTKCLNLRLGGAYPYRKPDAADGGKKKSEALKKFYASPESANVRKKISESNKGRLVSAEHKAILSTTLKNTVRRLKEAGDWDRVVELNRAAHLGKKQSEETISKRNASIKKTKDEKYGGKYNFSDDARRNIGQSQLGNEKHAQTWDVTSADGSVEQIKNLAKWMRDNGLVKMRDGVRVKHHASGQVVFTIAKVGAAV